MSRQPLLIVGASGRAAAASALRAGFDPFVLDLFADADTERLCPVRKLPMDDYPHGFVALAKTLPPMPWMYTGGLENHPNVVAGISESRELWGNGPDVLAKVRDPARLAEVLRADRHGVFKLTLPRTCQAAVPSDDIRWLRKPRRGAGGTGIRFATAEDLAGVGPDAVLQEYVPGTPVSVVYASGGRANDWLGMTRQLVGEPWLHARPFQYCGNLALHWSMPCDYTSASLTPFNLAGSIPIRGVWGIDFINAEGRMHLLEVNPRYPASLELIEFRKGVGFLAHLDATRTVPRWKVPVGPIATVGKAVYYAPHSLTIPPSGPWDDALARCTDVWRRPDFADIPHPGDSIPQGQPVLTILAEAATEAACEQRLRERAAELDRFFAE